MVDDLKRALETFGGPTGLAARLIDDKGRPATPANVSMWVYRKHVPYRWREPLRAALERPNTAA